MSQPSVSTAWRNAALVVAIVAALGVAGCKKSQPTTPVASGPAENASAAPAAASTAVETDAELLTKAKTAENEKRLYAPAGDNAIEYYLQLRARNPNDETAKAALTDLFPYAMIATEQTLQKASAAKDPAQSSQFKTEAARIFALLERVDANAPSLPRLRESMQKVAAAELKAQQDAAKKAQDDLQKKADADKAAQLAKQQADAAAKAAAAASAAAEPPKPATRPAPTPAPTAAATPPPAPSPANPEPPAPKPAAHAGMPEAINSPQPTYPRDALRDGVSGEVTVSFTVNADGSVSGAAVVSSNPRRVFDGAALEAIRKWKFEPPGEPVSGKKTFAFNPGN